MKILLSLQENFKGNKVCQLKGLCMGLNSRPEFCLEGLLRQ